MRRDWKGLWPLPKVGEREHEQESQPSEGGGRVSEELSSRAFLPSLDCSSCFSGEIQWHSHLLPHQALGRGKGSAPVEE